jgi:hypothetical protein
MAKIEKDSGMAKRLVAAVAGGDRPVDVDNFGRPHMRPEDRRAALGTRG